MCGTETAANNLLPDFSATVVIRKDCKIVKQFSGAHI